MSIAFREGLQIDPPTMEKIVQASHNDLRQVLNVLSVWRSKKQGAGANAAQKDIKLGPFDVIRKLYSEADGSGLSIGDKIDLYFQDYDIVPLMMEENYLNVVPHRPGLHGANANSPQAQSAM